MKELKNISEKCINCELCQKECQFLRKHGKPKDIAESHNPSDNDHQAVPFECSLCQLCAAVCPVDVNPGDMFLGMRRELANQGNGDYREYSPILGYERRGTSQRYTYYAIPAGCDTIFFPGCTLQGTRPDNTLKLYEHMKKDIPALGIVLDCCTKPSHDLGRQDYFNIMFHEMKDFLVRNGVSKVLLACPDCYEVFRKYGGGLSVRTVYEFMVENGLPNKKQVNGTVTIHDPCVIRWEEAIHSAVRDLCTRKGLTIEEMPHHGKTTMCCGEGGAVGCVSPRLANKWGALIKNEANGRRIVTYCAGCANLLAAITPTSHVLDVLFEPETALSGKAKVSKSPVTYLNRLRLKKRLKNTVNAPTTRERTLTRGEQKKKGTVIKRVFFLWD